MISHALATHQQPPLSCRTPLNPFRRRLLVVEDDLDMRPIFDRIRSAIASNLQLDWAVSVPDAVDWMNRIDYDLVISDFLLEGHDSGLTLKHWCEYSHPMTPFVMMSAFPVADSLAGANPSSAFLRKPFTVEQLRAFIVEQLFGS